MTWTAWCPASTRSSAVSLLGIAPTTFPSISTCHARPPGELPDPRPGASLMVPAAVTQLSVSQLDKGGISN